MSEEDWQTIESAPEDREVWTKIDDGHGVRNVQRMKRQGRLWFIDNGDMYVYYTPTHWTDILPGDR